MRFSHSETTSPKSNLGSANASLGSDDELTPLVIPDSKIDLDDIYDVAVSGRRIELLVEVPEILQKGRHRLEEKLAAGEVIYGINTGFGGNSHLVIDDDQLALHQRNLLIFLSAGIGDRFSDEYVRAAQLLTVLALLRGWSGVRPTVVSSLAAHINAGIVPFVPRYGSVGASGDLIPSSYIARALCGFGKVNFQGLDMNASQALDVARIAPVRLEAKEGLALVNGTRMMTGAAILTWRRFRKTFDAAVGAVALAVCVLRASHAHYDARIHLAKGHPGQIAVALVLRNMLGTVGSPIEAQKPFGAGSQMSDAIQEVYSIRCAPQLLGVVPESLESTRIILEREAMSANDNPLIDPVSGDVLHGGNFMGQHVSRAMDALKIDIALVGNHMHAIMALMMDSRFSRGLPNSLTARLGLYQGMKGVQLAHTSLVAHLRQESAPSSVHTMMTEQFNQDIVSLGLHAAMGAADMELKLRYVVAMTLLAACQGIDLRRCLDQLSPAAEVLYYGVRKISPILDQDRAMDSDIEGVAHALERGDISPLRVEMPTS